MKGTPGKCRREVGMKNVSLIVLVAVLALASPAEAAEGKYFLVGAGLNHLDKETKVPLEGSLEAGAFVGGGFRG